MIAEMVEWDDSSSETGDHPWVTPAELDAKLSESRAMRCYSVGWVAREDDETLTLAVSYALEGGEVSEWGQPLTIPKVAIRDRFPVPAVL